MNIWETILKSAEKYPDKIMVMAAGEAFRYSEMLEYSKQLALELSKTGIKRGSRVIVYLNDSPDYIAALYAVNMAGMVFVPLSPQVKDAKLCDILRHSGAEAVITSSELAEVVAAISPEEVPDVKHITVLGSEGDLPGWNWPCCRAAGFVYKKGRPVILEEADWQEDEMTAIFYLWDKNGMPKGIMLSSKNIMTNMDAIIEYLKMTYRDNLLVLKSMSLVGTVTGEILASAAVGATIAILGGITHAGIILKAIQDYKITGFFAMPLMLHQIMEYKRREKYSTDSLRYIQTGAAKLLKSDVEQLMEMYKGVALYYIYGLSEASPRVLHLKPDEMLIKAGSVGRPVKNCSVELLDADKKPCVPGSIGELYVQGPNVMLGYYKNAGLSEEAITPYGLKTGDLAYMDDEGYFYLAGRADNMINQGGFHVYPAEIEKAIRMLDRVSEVNVEGVPDELLGQKIKASVTPKPGETLTPGEIYDFCYATMESSKIPKIIEVL
ncbi:fatty-acyl-CoA synthase/long-chain acyl-CoA synthetase [Anaerobacterium chartisolvens]|uniref:Fatty-acyl-CoA synthase/long-chain acyl-CoA synthetase n=1 Tax=Anaerobacterium chartisolvens TaxID=1297424 RepID=A0A369AT54_9FIRM|nr:class I adenylate-forming enzyme family protein [Anaerobacterium chartisolvens]RCX12552.1 fatty-acyl-CoA synthase/long-chain acyl-CoA synthetase [Anaerobacterium chartisolvens]